MEVSIKVEYNTEEVGKMVVAKHGCEFGQAPFGYKWAAYDYYGGFRVVAEKIEQEPVVDISEVTGNEEGIEENR